jgi:hypothetical protein
MMAYFDTKGLFGATPEELQRQLFADSQQRHEKALLELSQQTNAPMAAYALNRRWMRPPSVESFADDPRVTAVRQQAEAAKQALAGFDLTTEKGKLEAASSLMSMGMIEAATKLMNAAKIQGTAQERYKTVGNRIFDKQTGKFLEDTGSAKKNIQKIKTMVDGKSVTAFVDASSGVPTIVGSFPAPPENMNASMQKVLDATQDTAISARNSVGELEGLISQLEATPFEGGVTKQISEGLKSFLGEQDLITYLNMRTREIANAKAMDNLPPGAASDADVRLALEGVPDANSPSSYILQFLKAVQSAKKKIADYAMFKSNYMSVNGNTRGLLKAWDKEQKNQTPSVSEVATQAAPQPTQAKQPTPLMPEYSETNTVNWSDL